MLCYYGFSFVSFNFWKRNTAMKSSETKVECPVCGVLVSRDWLNNHIGVTAFYERKGSLQKSKEHANYQFSKIKK